MESTILIVEDEAITAMELQDCLIKLGYQVPAIAATGENAIELANKMHPDLILMDIILKGKMTGTTAAKEIVAENKVPIIFLTAYNDAKTFNQAKESKPFAYLTKPYNINDLRMAIELTLQKHKMQLAEEVEIGRLKNEFLSNLSHELRTPLNGINGFIELAHAGKINLHENQDIIDDILNDSHRLIGIIDEVIEYTDLDSGKIQFKLQLANIRTLIEEILQSIDKNNFAISLHVDKSIKDIVIDSLRLQDALKQFISNAIKFSPESKLIEINVKINEERCLTIEIKDHGIGIAESEMKNLFQPFKQLDMSMTKKYSGIGLGLVLAKKIIELQGGKIQVKSELGKGSSFIVILPLKTQ